MRHHQALAAATGSVRQGTASSTGASPLGAGWTSLGPQPISGLSTYGNTAGRITALAANGSTIYAGSAGGGVWKSSDGGVHWTALTDGQATLAIGSLAVTGWGTANETIYAGTGEANLCLDCQPSQGVLKSTDGGASWSLLGQATFTNDTFFIGGLAIDRTNTQRLFAATNHGVYLSTDGGTNWSALATGTGRADVVAQDPGDPTRFWVTNATSCSTSPTSGTIGFLSTATTPISWNPTWSGSAPSLGTNATRIGLGVGSGNTVYAAVAACPNGRLAGVLKSTNAGASWSSLANVPDFFSSAPLAPAEYQGWYDNVVAVDPLNPAHVAFGGITLDVSADGGTSFTDVARPYSSGPLHPDFHALVFTGSSLVAGNDGGVYSTTNFGQSWANRNATLSITQFYAGSSVDLAHLAGGSQDNGTAGNPQGAAPSTWLSLLDGDGMWTSMFPRQPTLIGEVSGLDMFQFDYSGSGTVTEVAPCPGGTADPSCSDPVGFVAPFVVDPASSDAAHARVYAGTNVVYRTTTGGLPSGGTASGGAWTKASPDLTTGSGSGSNTHQADWINTMGVGSGSAAGTVITGSWYGKVALSAAAPTATSSSGWIDITGNLPAWSRAGSSGNAWITGVAVNPLDNSEAWVTVGQLTGGRVFHTHNATSAAPTWSDISTGLPTSLVVDSILVDPVKPQNVYLGTDAGAMVCTTCADLAGGASASGSWVPLGTGLPNVRVDMLTLTADRADIVAWTHGRGAWFIPVPLGRPGAALSPSSLSFGPQVIGTTSAPQDLTLSNNGSAPLAISGISVSGDFSRIASGNDCNAALPAGSSCTIRIVFTPTASGTRSGSVTVSDDAADSPQSASLTGQGATPPGGKYNPIAPKRILDTRYGPYPVGRNGAGPIGANSSFNVAVADGNIAAPTNATAVVVNVTVTNTTGNSYLTVFPAGSGLPIASSLNWRAGQTVPNLVEVPVGNGGEVTVYNGSGSADVIFDLEGWVSPPSDNPVADGVFKSLVPYRIMDTRYGPYPLGHATPAPVQGGQTITVQVGGRPDFPTGVPWPGAEAVVLNVTVTDAVGPSYLTVYPTGQTRPTASNLNFAGGDTVPNRVTVPLGSNGQIQIFNGWNAADVVVDVNGYYTDASASAVRTGRFSALTPTRILDTRYGPAPAGRGLGPVGGGQTVYVQVAGANGLPAMTDQSPPTAVALNVTVTDTSASSYLIVYPADASRPTSSDLNWPPGKTVPNMVVVKLSANGQIAIYNGFGSTDIVVDVLGWYS